MEPTHAYYNCMAQITVILREHHSNCYRLGELARMSKDCFYMGLLPENRPMVVHLKDQPHTTPLDLLRVLLEQEENDAFDTYPIPTIYVYQIDTATEASGALSLTATLLTKGMMGTLSALPNWTPPQLRQHPRLTLYRWVTHWMPSSHGTMMDFS